MCSHCFWRRNAVVVIPSGIRHGAAAVSIVAGGAGRWFSLCRRWCGAVAGITSCRWRSAGGYSPAAACVATTKVSVYVISAVSSKVRALGCSSQGTACFRAMAASTSQLAHCGSQPYVVCGLWQPADCTCVTAPVKRITFVATAAHRMLTLVCDNLWQPEEEALSAAALSKRHTLGSGNQHTTNSRQRQPTVSVSSKTNRDRGGRRRGHLRQCQATQKARSGQGGASRTLSALL